MTYSRRETTLDTKNGRVRVFLFLHFVCIPSILINLRQDYVNVEQFFRIRFAYFKCGATVSTDCFFFFVAITRKNDP